MYKLRSYQAKNRKSYLIFSVIFFGLLFSFTPIIVNASGGSFAGGDGSSGNPWQIEDCADLQAINNNSSADYVLISDVNCLGTTFSSLNSLSGTLDGQNHTISNVTIAAGSSAYQGLFSGISTGGLVTNFGLVNISVTGGAYVGALAGTSDGDISRVFATGTVSCGNYCGGLVGTSSGTMTSSYSNIAVSGALYTGGVIGTSGPFFTPTDLYAVGSVNVGLYTGGIIGTAGPSGVLNSFYDQTTTGHNDSGDGTPKTTAQMKSISTFTDTATAGLTTPWDFVGTAYDDVGSEDIWDMDPAFNNGYPFFTWQYSDINPPSAPSAFSAGTSGANTTLSWTNPTAGDFVSLTARRSASSFPSSISDGVAVVSGTTTQTIAQSGLSDGTYYYSIFALDNNGNVSTAATTSVIIDTTAPSSPSDFSASASTTGAILSWTNPINSDFSSSTIRRGSTTHPTSTSGGTLVSQNLTGTSITDSSLSDGIYYYSIFAFDTHNNSSSAATTTVTIDSTAPVITILGNENITINAGSTYSDAGATATDILAGDLTNSIVTQNSVDTSHAGVYTVTYNVSDPSANAATPITRTVTVLAGGGGAVTVIQPSSLNNSSNDALDFTINNGNKTVLSPHLVLNLNADPKTVKGYAVSLEKDFNFSSILPYTPSTTYVLPNVPGSYTIYLKYYSTTGHSSSVLSHSIIYSSVDNADLAKEINPSVINQFYKFKRTLRLGSKGADVKWLQIFLNNHGFLVDKSGIGSPGHESENFGKLTALAVTKFQEANSKIILEPLNLKKGTGFFGMSTIKIVNSLLNS